MNRYLLVLLCGVLTSACASGSEEFSEQEIPVEQLEFTNSTEVEEPIQPVANDVVVPPVPEPVPIEAFPARANPPCDTLAFGDGLGGDLWLPVSRGDGLPVYLLNGGWQEPAVVEAQLTTGGFEQGNFTGFFNPEADGTLRPHFRFTRGCTAYTGLFIISDATQVCEVSLPRGVCERID